MTDQQTTRLKRPKYLLSHKTIMLIVRDAYDCGKENASYQNAVDWVKFRIHGKEVK